MKATLYKLKEGYVLCSDEEIKEGDLYTHKGKFILKSDGGYKKGLQKILTQLPDLSSLSPDEQKEIGQFDLEKLGYDRAVERMWHPNSMETRRVGNEIIKAVKYGFQKALSLTADRRFTEEDMRKAFDRGEWDGFGKSKITRNNIFKNFIKSLSEPKSWEVEYVEENGIFKITNIL